ncbi:MAG TPA: SAM-dependent methyltransferase [Thermotogota bacterium]|nr:SAM-dependent methyltransferase [Thermotogota bacterium]HPJ89377.1 SAM-dependent methyltransferase [Thermotogota bacterium]HPR97115.1 SAM-dependent methyltransferase [Thermotogota bacterium]
MKNTTEKRFENKSSRTAAWTCTCRALSYHEKDSHYKSGDYIAPTLLPNFLRLLIKATFVRKLFKNIFIPTGMYEYVIARTKYFDSVLERAIKNDFEQIFIFGAGFDSRGIRFFSDNLNTKVYELDAPNTQSAKINQLEKRRIKIPPNLVFVPIDFNKESLKAKLMTSEFRKDKKTLYMLEGLTMYLDQGGIDSTFKIIDEFSAADSEIVFDYIQLSVLKKENVLYGEKDIYETVKNANEAWRFGLDTEQIESFLETYHFNTIENLTSADLEDRYFKDLKAKRNGKINATHCIVHAKK